MTRGPEDVDEGSSGDWPAWDSDHLSHVSTSGKRQVFTSHNIDQCHYSITGIFKYLGGKHAFFLFSRICLVLLTTIMWFFAQMIYSSLPKVTSARFPCNQRTRQTYILGFISQWLHHSNLFKITNWWFDLSVCDSIKQRNHVKQRTCARQNVFSSGEREATYFPLPPVWLPV